MNVAVVIMSAGKEPSLTNIQTFKETIAADAIDMMSKGELRHKYHFFTYVYGRHPRAEGPDCSSVNDIEVINDEQMNEWTDVYIPSQGYAYQVPYIFDESIYRTFEKTYEMFSYLYALKTYDVVVRINISSALNIRVLDRLLGVYDPRHVYCCALNSITEDPAYANILYPRGDFIMMSMKTIEKVLPYMKNYMFCDMNMTHRITVPHADDCLIGLALKDLFEHDSKKDGRDEKYHKRYELLLYNYIPVCKESNLEIWNDLESQMKAYCSPFAITSRIKSVPQGQVSGYSWGDNEYRKSDPEKMRCISKIMKERGFVGMSGDFFFKTLVIDKMSDRAKGAVMVAHMLMPLKNFLT